MYATEVTLLYRLQQPIRCQLLDSLTLNWLYCWTHGSPYRWSACKLPILRLWGTLVKSKYESLWPWRMTFRRRILTAAVTICKIIWNYPSRQLSHARSLNDISSPIFFGRAHSAWWNQQKSLDNLIDVEKSCLSALQNSGIIDARTKWSWQDLSFPEVRGLVFALAVKTGIM